MDHWEISVPDWEDLDLDIFDFEDVDETLDQDCLSLTDSTGNSVMNVSQKRRRKRKYSDETRLKLKAAHERDKLLRPRILKNDFRRHFANMCTNVFNSGDYRVVMEYIHTYCAKDVQVRHVDLRPYNKIGVPGRNLDIIGQESLAKYWYTAMTNCPDVVCFMHNACVKIRSDGTASVKCNFELRGNAVLVVSKGIVDPSNRLYSSRLEDMMDSSEIENLLERYIRAKRTVQNAQNPRRRRTQNNCIFPSNICSNEKVLVAVDSADVINSRQTLSLLDQRVLSPSQLHASVRYLLSNQDTSVTNASNNCNVQMGPQGQLIITAAADVLCSYEIEFNTENKVSSVAIYCRK